MLTLYANIFPTANLGELQIQPGGKASKQKVFNLIIIRGRQTKTSLKCQYTPIEMTKGFLKKTGKIKK